MRRPSLSASASAAPATTISSRLPQWALLLRLDEQVLARPRDAATGRGELTLQLRVVEERVDDVVGALGAVERLACGQVGDPGVVTDRVVFDDATDVRVGHQILHGLGGLSRPAWCCHYVFSLAGDCEVPSLPLARRRDTPPVPPYSS